MIDLTNPEEQNRAVATPRPATARGLTIEAIINAWIDEEAKSPGTQYKYREIITKFRRFLEEANLDLIFTSSEKIDFCATIADAAQMFSKMRSSGSYHQGEVAQSTIAQRLYILSSFYRYAIRRKHLKETNPIDLVSKDQVEAYTHTEAINPDTIASKLQQIDRSTEAGMQAYCLLAIAVYTGKRVDEINTLSRKSISIEPDERIKLDFPHTKREKHLQDILTKKLSFDLLAWLNYFYQQNFMLMPENTPLWVNIYHESKRGQPLGYHALSDLCFKYLGTRRFHATRGTFAEAMRRVGADVTTIQDRLGHSSLDTTRRYLKALARDVNPHAAELAELFGLE